MNFKVNHGLKGNCFNLPLPKLYINPDPHGLLILRETNIKWKLDQTEEGYMYELKT